MRLAKVFAFGEKVQDISFKNRVVDAILATAGGEGDATASLIPAGLDVDIIYRATRTESPARRLMVDLHVAYGDSTYVNHEEVMNHEFLIDLSQRLLRDMEHERVEVWVNCDYHEHEEGTVCPQEGVQTAGPPERMEEA